MLVIYDNTGFIQQVVYTGAFELLQPQYADIGLNTLMSDGKFDPTKSYVVAGAIIPRPELTIVAPVTTVAADGVTELRITFTPTGAAVAVTFQDQVIAQEDVTDGTIAFSATHPGDYAIGITPVFPWLSATVNIKAT